MKEEQHSLTGRQKIETLVFQLFNNAELRRRRTLPEGRQ